MEENEDKRKERLQRIGRELRGKFTTNEANRRQKETEWLEDLRQIRGIYDPDVKIEKGNSHVYPKMTRAKTKAVLSRLNDMLFSATDRNFTIDTTPEPEIAPELAAMLGQKVLDQMTLELQKQQSENWPGGMPQLDPEEVSKRMADAIKKYAQTASNKMQSEIDDQLLETKYTEEAKKVLESGVNYGTGIIRGPHVQTIQVKEWHFVDDVFVAKIKEKKYPILKFTRLWDFYPDMGVTEIKKAEGYFIRHVMNKLEMQKLSKRTDFDGEYIKGYIKDHPKGDAKTKEYEQDLQSIDADTQSTLSSSVPETSNKNYEVLEYWGLLEDENEDVYEAEAWLLGNTVIKEAKNNIADGRRPDRIFYYEKDETSIFGQGLARIMRHSQAAVAGAARAALDNAATVSGPIVEMNISTLIGQPPDAIYPRLMVFREGYGVDSQYPALRSLEFESHITELLALLDKFKSIGDEETCLPAWMTGEPPKNTNETVGGASIKVGNVLVSLKDIVKNFDNFTSEVINAVYQWNMEYNPRNDIKGDFLIKAQGSSSLITKEVRMQALNLLAQTLTPEDWAYIPRYTFLVERWKAHDMPMSMLRTEEEAAPFLASLNDPEMRKLEIELKLAEIEYKKTQSLKMVAGAKDKNVDANLKGQKADADVSLTKAKEYKQNVDSAGVIHDKTVATMSQKKGGVSGKE